MSLAAPGFLWAALGAALVVVALHLLSMRRPRPTMLPTARFVPQRTEPAVARAIRPSDLVLLLLRVASVLGVGLALARPAIGAPGRPARVVLVDRSRSIGDTGALVAAARQWARAGDAVVVFDSTAHVTTTDTLAALAASSPSSARGSISAALIAGVRAADSLGAPRRAVEMVLVSPLAAEELDAATAGIRAHWPGEIRLVPVPAAPGALAPTVGVRAAAGDPLPTLAATPIESAGVRVVRDGLAPSDSEWVRAGGALVDWPASVARADSADSPRAVWVGSATLIGLIERRDAVPAGRPVAWWNDGTPAATERPVGRGCIRSVRIALPAAGDLVLTDAFRGLFAALTEPCGGAMRAEGADSTLTTLLARRPAVSRSAPTVIRAEIGVARWLLVIALGLLIVEGVVRRRSQT